MKSKLALVEARIQRLVEGSLAKLFPIQEPPLPLAPKLVQAMRQNLQAGENGSASAPNLYTLFVNPKLLSEPGARNDISEFLRKTLQNATEDTEITFANPIQVIVIADPDLQAGETRVIAQFGIQSPGETRSLNVNGKGGSGEHPLLSKAFLIINRQRVVALNKPMITIGRQKGNDITLENPNVSRLHAQIRLIENHFYIFDLGSTGGTILNDQRVKKRALYPGDVISLAGTTMIYGQDEIEQEDITRPIIRN